MNENLLTEWVDSVIIAKEEWDRAREQACRELGIDIDEVGSIVSMFAPDHQAFEIGGFHNWTRLMPDDAVIQVHQTSDLVDTILKIASKTYENIAATQQELDSPIVHSEANISDYIDEKSSEMDSLQAGQITYLVTQIVGLFSGNVDIDRLSEQQMRPQEQRVEAPDHEATVLVNKRNERNFEDIGIFTVNDGKEFFGEAFGDSTAMFDLLLRADLTSNFVARDVAFDSEGNSWGPTTTPEDGVSVMSTDHKNRVDFGEVPNPRQSFGDTWGDLGNMMSGLGEEEYSHEYTPGRVDWQIVLGV